MMSTSVLLRFFGLSFIAVAWLVPNHYPPWSSFYNDSCIAAGLALLILSCGRIGSDKRFPVAALVIGLLAVLPWLQFALGLLAYSGDAWVASLYLLGFALAIWVGHVLEPRRSLAIPLAWTCLVASLASAAMALVQAAQLNVFGIWVLDATEGMRPYANLAQPNHLATLIGFGFASLFLLYERRQVSALSGIALSVLLLLGTSVTQSRTGLLYGPVAWVLLFFWSRRGVVFRTRLSVVTAITAAQWVATALWPMVQTTALMAASTSLGQREAKTVRFLVWPILVDAISTRPWAGFGWLQVGAAELSAVDRHPPATELYLQAHNIVLDLAIFCGVPLAAVLVVVMGYWLVTRIARTRSVEGAAGMLVVAMLLTHAMLELPHYSAYFLVPAGIWIGIIERQVGGATALPARWAWPVAVLAAGLTSVLWADYPRMEEEFRLVRFEGARIRTVPSTEPMPVNPAFSSLTAFLEQSRRPQPTTKMTDAELTALRDAMNRYPYAPLIKRYASALALAGDTEEARRAFGKIRLIYGDGMSRDYRKELREEVEAGSTALAEFERSLPP